MPAGQDPVNWLLSHRELLVVLFAAAVWFLNRTAAAKRKAAARPGESIPAQPAGDGASAGASAEEEEAERTRRVQEEIRRKIAARRAPAPSRAASFEPPRIEEEPEPFPPSPASVQGREMEEVLLRQQGLEKELRALEAGRAATVAAAKRGAGFPPGAGASAAHSSAAASNPWLAELRNPAGVRRAVVLREILGAPVSLR